MKRQFVNLFAFALILALMISFLPAQAQPAYALSSNVVISQVYGGGGNAGSTFKNDFIVLYNFGGAPVDLSTWSVQYGSAAGAMSGKTNLTGTIQPGQYYLIQEAAGTGGTTNLPTPDAIGTLALSATVGKVALVNNQTLLTCGAVTENCFPNAAIIDFVGFGTTANNFEGSGPTPAPSNTTAVLRGSAGCTETDNNNSDFTVDVPNPLNSASPFHYCTGPTNPSGVGASNPSTLFAGDSTLLTVAVTPGTNPPSSGLNVTCDLTTIGGSATQVFYNDGTNGDAVAGDNTFSFQASISGSTGAGAKSLPCGVADAEGRSGNAPISLTVQVPPPLPGNVVISQAYGGGGNSGAILKNDFIELYNRTSNPISLAGWSVQYGAATGSTWQVTPLSGSIAPGKYFLVQEAAGASGTLNLPTPDAVGTIAMSATGAKVALVNTTTALAVACPVGTSISDLVGYGTTANCYEGTGRAPAPSNTTAVLRLSNGAQDTDNNNADFVAGAPNPRNSIFPFVAVGTATPATLIQGETTLLTVAVTPGTDPVSTGIAVTCNLGPIGGVANQVMFDDGTNGDAIAGDNIFSFTTFDTSPGTQNLSCTFLDAQGRSGTTTISLTLLTVLPIGTVNGPVADTDDGAAHTSPYVGQIVMVKGVIYETTLQAISNSTNTYKGFFIQNTAASADADANTSDGIFVFMNAVSTLSAPGGNTYTPVVGDEIVLAGTVNEYFNMTELTTPSLATPVVRSGVDLDAEIAPFVADPPASLADANRYWERRQGMRGQVPANSIVLNGRNVFSPADAEVWLASPDSAIALRLDAYTRRAFRDAHPLDDNYDANNWDGNGYRILMGSLGIKATAGDAQALIAPARTFDIVTDAPVGGVNYSFSKYRLEVTDQPVLSEGPDPALNNPPQTFDRSINYSIADYNLENLYDFRDNPFSGCDFASDTGCSQVAPFLSAVTPPYDYVPASDADYQARLNDIALEIINNLHSPDILMVQEVENQDICSVTGGALTCGAVDNADGKPDVLQELALKIAANGGPAYDAAFDRDSSDLRGIAPSFLYRTERVQLLPPAGDPVLGISPAIGSYTAVPYDADVSNPKTLNAVLPAGVAACETSWVFPRAPDVALFRVYSTSIGVGSHRDVYVIDNHFKSGPDSCTGHRTEQAKYNAALVAYIQAANPSARIVLGGDLNVYPRPDDPFAPIGQPASTDQLGSLYAPGLGLKNLWEVLLANAPESAYSYVYLGMAQTLDQMFINQPMLADLQQYRIAHINSDFPADYSGDVARGTSDHDPNVAVFTINDPPTVDAGGPYTVNEGSNLTVSAAATDPEGGPLSYAWDLDNNGTFETPGQSVYFSAADGPALQTIAVQVTDNGGLSAIASTTVTINNLPPTASLGNNGPVDEGNPAMVAFADPTDPSAIDLAAGLHYAFACDGGSLAGATYASTSAIASVTCTFDDGPSTHSILGRVIDKDDGFSEYTTAVLVTNVAPSAIFTAPAVLNEGASFSIGLTGALDPSVADTNAGFQYAFDCGSGYSVYGSTTSATCPAIDNPGQTVRGKITDKDGGVNEYSATVTVNNVSPSVGPITAPSAPALINTAISVSASFTDAGVLDTHTAVWDWGDGSTSVGTVTEAGGSGSVAGSHVYNSVGLYKLTLTVTDKDGASSQVFFESIVVYDPNGGFVIGAGWINSPAGAYLPNPSLKGKALFNFEVKYKKGATVPDGLVTFMLPSGVLNFTSTAVNWMVIDKKPGLLCWLFNRCTSALQIKGTGTINGRGAYQFMIWATAGNPDTFHIKIWNRGPGGSENVVYDNLTDQPIGGGSILLFR